MRVGADGQQYGVPVSSLRRAPGLLGRPNTGGPIGTGGDLSTDQTGGAERDISVVARAMGRDLDGRRLTGIGCIGIAAVSNTCRRGNNRMLYPSIRLAAVRSGKAASISSAVSSAAIRRLACPSP